MNNMNEDEFQIIKTFLIGKLIKRVRGNDSPLVLDGTFMISNVNLVVGNQATRPFAVDTYYIIDNIQKTVFWSAEVVNNLMNYSEHSYSVSPPYYLEII